jgi:hypothetical protein
MLPNPVDYIVDVGDKVLIIPGWLQLDDFPLVWVWQCNKTWSSSWNPIDWPGNHSQLLSSQWPPSYANGHNDGCHVSDP